jgi:hypothetical protein
VLARRDKNNQQEALVMKLVKAVWIVLVMSSIVVSGCATVEPRSPEVRILSSRTATCKPGGENCEVRIAVSCTVFICDVDVNPFVLVVRGKNTKPIDFEVTDRDSEFVGDISFTPDPDEPNGTPRPANSGSKKQTFNNPHDNKTVGVYKYSFTLKLPNTKQVTVDPFVVND